MLKYEKNLIYCIKKKNINYILKNKSLKNKSFNVKIIDIYIKMKKEKYILNKVFENVK